MATISIEDGTLNVILSFWEKVGGLSGNISVPLSHVRGATNDPTFIKNGLGLRLPGSAFPGLLYEGHYRKKGDRMFASWRKGEQIVVIELEGQKWDRLVIGCSDANALAQSINNALI